MTFMKIAILCMASPSVQTCALHQKSAAPASATGGRMQAGPVGAGHVHAAALEYFCCGSSLG